MFFAAHDPAAYKLNGRRFSQPPLVWKVNGNDLWVRALPESRRPVAETQLMVAPYWNVDGESGWTCQGSMHAPDDMSVRSMPLWEQAFYQSEFTHHTGTRRLTIHPVVFSGFGAVGRRPTTVPSGAPDIGEGNTSGVHHAEVAHAHARS